MQQPIAKQQAKVNPSCYDNEVQKYTYNYPQGNAT